MQAAWIRRVEDAKPGRVNVQCNELGNTLKPTKDKTPVALGYAVALIDELEHPQHHQQRFTVGY